MFNLKKMDMKKNLQVVVKKKCNTPDWVYLDPELYIFKDVDRDVRAVCGSVKSVFSDLALSNAYEDYARSMILQAIRLCKEKNSRSYCELRTDQFLLRIYCYYDL